MKTHPRFISFEGIDFSGKTTQLNIVREKLDTIGRPTHLVREPGGTVISEKLRPIILDKAHAEMHATTEILLYSAARSQLVHQEIWPMLERGDYVIADRFYDSTTAYQGAGRQLDIDFVARLNRFATSGLTPGRTIFIDISPEESVRRRKLAGRGRDRLESESIAFYHSIREAYLTLCRDNPDRFVVIPGEDSIEDIAVQVWEQIVSFWSL